VVEIGGVLGEIAGAKRSELRQRFDGVSIDALRAEAVPTRRRFTSALARPGARFILEIKKASPSAGWIRGEADVGALARGYSGVADALSVLTDATAFGGSIDDLKAARSSFDGPVLAKDFMLDRRQVVEARLAGADAVLVMLSLLDDREARIMIDEARRLDMDALVEVHDETEMRRAIALDAPLIGINNRDLRDLSVDLATTERLAGLARDRVLVSESGISGRADVDRLAPHADAFLVGTALMRAEEPAQAARALIFGRVKLCGLNRSADVEAGRAAAFAGFVFVPGSPRHISAERAAPLAGIARKAGIQPVGVFRNTPSRIVADIATLLNLHAVQLHGTEDSDYIRTLRARLPRESEIWTSVSVGRDPLGGRGGNRLVFDNGNGGTGLGFDWALLNGHPELSRALVAGGIGPANAREAMRLGTYAIDVGSALDSLPGVKSPEKILALFEALRPASRQRVRECA
jgi:indole-3-glycerol phosphate synthase / phosphoribosylanthranilate isomerase